jgi:hypothetical protein
MKRNVLLSGLLIAVVGLVGWASMERFSFASGSRIWVEGTSTLHAWTCNAPQINGTLDATSNETGITGITGLTVAVPVSALDCDNGTMNGKLRDALGASGIGFTLNDARVGNVNNGRFAVEANGLLTIRNTTRSYRIAAEGREVGNGQYRFTGSVPITMSDFGVRPPTALLGTIRTGDRVTVHFDVTVAR